MLQAFIDHRLRIIDRDDLALPARALFGNNEAGLAQRTAQVVNTAVRLHEDIRVQTDHVQ